MSSKIVIKGNELFWLYVTYIYSIIINAEKQLFLQNDQLEVSRSRWENVDRVA